VWTRTIVNGMIGKLAIVSAFGQVDETPFT
jgi:hypothetical protein